MESLLGHLSDAAMVVCPGRLFLHQLFALLPTVPKPHHHIRLNRSVQADLHWWDFFLKFWNGISLFPPVSLSVNIYSDASGSCSCGAFDPDRGWFSTLWPPHWSQVEITVKELVPVIIAVAV